MASSWSIIRKKPMGMFHVKPLYNVTRQMNCGTNTWPEKQSRMNSIQELEAVRGNHPHEIILT